MNYGPRIGFQDQLIKLLSDFDPIRTGISSLKAGTEHRWNNFTMVTNKTSKFLISCFSAFFVFQSLTLSAGESIVGYVLAAQGPIEKQYSAGMAISNKTKIDVSGDSKLTVFHHKKCNRRNFKYS